MNTPGVVDHPNEDPIQYELFIRREVIDKVENLSDLGVYADLWLHITCFQFQWSEDQKSLQGHNDEYDAFYRMILPSYSTLLCEFFDLVVTSNLNPTPSSNLEELIQPNTTITLRSDLDKDTWPYKILRMDVDVIPISTLEFQKCMQAPVYTACERAVLASNNTELIDSWNACNTLLTASIEDIRTQDPGKSVQPLIDFLNTLTVYLNGVITTETEVKADPQARPYTALRDYGGAVVQNCLIGFAAKLELYDFLQNDPN